MTIKEISIIIPVLNEEDNVTKLVEDIDYALGTKSITYELIFIDDHSTDKTRQIIESLATKYPISLYLKKGKQGKAYSLFEGFTHAQYDLIGIIDADLQYPPIKVPEMIEKIAGGADIVVANRKRYHDSKFRKILSRLFRIIFGRFLFGLKCDIQAGLKVFKKEIIEIVNFQPTSGWTFDLEFLYRSRQAGFKIASHDIVFHPRRHAESKVWFLKTGWELVKGALRLKINPFRPQHIPSLNQTTMIGAGVRFNRQKYITHTTLDHHKSAIQTFVRRQKLFLLAFLFTFLAGLAFQPLTTIRIFIAILSFIYFIDVVFNLFLILKSLHSAQEISFTDEELGNLDEASLPVYSILCPLYREADVLPQFLGAIAGLDWPKEKLDLILLLEEDDRETIQALNKVELPPYVRRTVVPLSLPKTKPKACNFGLSYARGEYVVIYDAEDLPDPLQLKKAYLGFKKAPKDVICLQAKLNYYNPNQNLLTRLFTAEYSLWFDVILTGLQSLNTTIPLGGTSNHFRRNDLAKLQGWDPFNVTEDADLGVRLFGQGYKTAIIDSITWEEANSKVGNWLRQRSRWIKGYMQTYLVHIRKTASPSLSKGLHWFFFQMTIGGKIAFILINPFLWITTFSYFAFYGSVGPTIESLYPPVVFYMALVSLVFGNFMFLYYYMIGVVKRGQWSLVKYIYLVPLYWLMISAAGFVALYQLLWKPHFWEKTIHGFHLDKSARKIIPEIVIKIEGEAGIIYPALVKSKLSSFVNTQRKYFAGLILVLAITASNFLNFAFNAYLGRKISLDDFALVNLFGALLSLSSIPFGAFLNTVNYRAGFLIGKFKDEQAAYHFWRYIRRRPLIISLLIAILWLISTPFWANYFRTEDIFLFILFGLILLSRFTNSADRGFLSARLMFISLAAVTLFEPVLKLILAFLLVELEIPQFTYASIPLSFIGAFLLGWVLVTRKKVAAVNFPSQQSQVRRFPKKFFFVSLLSGLSTMAFLSLDILLAKHFLTPGDAGRYALISLAGKMIFFMGGLSSQFITPLVSRSEGARQSSQKTFSFILGATTLLSLLGFVIFGLFGDRTIPLLYGPKTVSIIPYLIPFTLAMAGFTISRVFVSYYLTKKIYSFAIGAFLLAILQFVLINRYHSSLDAIVSAMLTVGLVNLALMVAFHLAKGWVWAFERNFADFLDLFLKRQEAEKIAGNRLRILIFNWRDTKHEWAGGAEVYIHELAKRWVAKGDKVTLFCGNKGKNPRREFVNGVEVIRRGGFYFVYLWAFFYYLLRFRGKYDVIIDCENGIPFFTPLYAKEDKFLLIHHVHQEVFRKSLPKPLAFLASFLETKVMPFVYKNIQIITVSDSSRQEILKHKLTNIEPIVIYNGVNLEKYKPAPKSQTPLILYLGRLQYYKSLNILIKVAKKVSKIMPEVAFIIAGEGEKKKDLMKFTRELNLESKIHFLGKVSEKVKIELYQKAWVFVNPSFIEGWGITTIEANACGTPVVASDVSGLRDSIQNPTNGFLIPYGDISSFAERIFYLLRNREVRDKMSAYSIDWAKNFSWDESADKFYAVIEVYHRRKNKNISGGFALEKN